MAVPGDAGQDPPGPGQASRPAPDAAATPMSSPQAAPQGAAAATSAAPTSEEVPARLGVFLGNCAVLAVLLIAVDHWISRFTNWNGVQMGVLGITGVLAAGAAFVKFLQEDRQKQLLKLIDQKILQRRWTWAWALCAGLILACFAGWFGSVELKSSETTSYQVKFYRAESNPMSAQPREPIAVMSLGPQETSKRLLATGFLGRQRFDIRIDGLPTLAHTVQAFHYPVPLNVPESFRKTPVILIHPAEWVSGTAARNPSWIRVTLGAAAPEVLKGYGGQTVWIGGRGRLKITSELEKRWSDEEPGYLRRLLTPKSLAPDAALAAGDKILVELFACDPRGAQCQPYVRAESEVADEASFPQEVYLNETVD